MPLLAHKTKIERPSRKAVRSFARACGTARKAWNWAYFENLRGYKAGEKIKSAPDLVAAWNKLRKEAFPWSYEITKWAGQKAIQDFEEARSRFFQRLSRFPKVKKKFKSKDSFYIGIPSIKGRYLRIPNLGFVKLAQEIRFVGKLRSATICREGDQWFASIMIDVPESETYVHTCNTQAVVGVDLGISTLATLSDGTSFENPKATKRYQRKLAHASRVLARRKKGSRNRRKAQSTLQKVHQKIKRVRLDALHKLTSFLVRTYRWIGIEDLNVRGMMKNSKMAKAIADANFGEFRRQLGYKSKLAGVHVAIADRWYPSSKLCSLCGYKLEELGLGVRNWECPACGAVHDRDLNASLNLRNVALSYRETQNACGEGVSPPARNAVRRRSRRRPSVKQESEPNSQIVNQSLIDLSPE